MSVSFALEQFFQITISDDKATAYIELVNWEEDFHCDVESMEALLADHQVVHGIQREALEGIAAKPAGYQFQKIAVAYATQPIPGEHGKIVSMLQSKPADHRPLETDDGKVDFKEITRLNNVSKGQLIATRIPPSPGKPGMSVTGAEMPPKAGKEARFKIGKNVVVDAEQVHMYAAIDGLLTVTDNGKINVFPIYEIHGDVDYSVGNIDFVGTVVIRGNVLSGFRIKSAGDIRVTGFVEGADLEAGGSIVINGGVIGYHKGCIQAAQHVKCAFVQDGNIVAGGDITVSQSIMHSTLRAAQSIYCNGTKGLIVGGVIQAGEKVTARTIGNSMSTVTVLEVGVLPELRNELKELRARQRQQLDHVSKTEKALNLLNQLAAAGQLTPDKLGLRIKLNATQKSHMSELAETKERIFEIEQTLEDTTKARVEVLNSIYGGSKIVIGRYTRFIKDASQRVVYTYIDGDIAMLPMT
ncbi:FapA family protein [Paenibacillus sp. JSM ZJ436]|uniref:DUF342 domain-containing protein n=1 Tax=Paenibacillus sp. JSM ZJ436 TaxID=3376190 RepID=UPI0037A62BC2